MSAHAQIQSEEELAEVEDMQTVAGMCREDVEYFLCKSMNVDKDLSQLASILQNKDSSKQKKLMKFLDLENTAKKWLENGIKPIPKQSFVTFMDNSYVYKPSFDNIKSIDLESLEWNESTSLAFSKLINLHMLSLASIEFTCNKRPTTTTTTVNTIATNDFNNVFNNYHNLKDIDLFYSQKQIIGNGSNNSNANQQIQLYHNFGNAILKSCCDTLKIVKLYKIRLNDIKSQLVKCVDVKHFVIDISFSDNLDYLLSNSKQCDLFLNLIENSKHLSHITLWLDLYSQYSDSGSDSFTQSKFVFGTSRQWRQLFLRMENVLFSIGEKNNLLNKSTVANGGSDDNDNDDDDNNDDNDAYDMKRKSRLTYHYGILEISSMNEETTKMICHKDFCESIKNNNNYNNVKDKRIQLSKLQINYDGSLNLTLFHLKHICHHFQLVWIGYSAVVNNLGNSINEIVYKNFGKELLLQGFCMVLRKDNDSTPDCRICEEKESESELEKTDQNKKDENENKNNNTNKNKNKNKNKKQEQDKNGTDNNKCSHVTIKGSDEYNLCIESIDETNIEYIVNNKRFEPTLWDHLKYLVPDIDAVNDTNDDKNDINGKEEKKCDNSNKKTSCNNGKHSKREEDEQAPPARKKRRLSDDYAYDNRDDDDMADANHDATENQDNDKDNDNDNNGSDSDDSGDSELEHRQFEKLTPTEENYRKLLQNYDTKTLQVVLGMVYFLSSKYGVEGTSARLMFEMTAKQYQQQLKQMQILQQEVAQLKNETENTNVSLSTADNKNSDDDTNDENTINQNTNNNNRNWINIMASLDFFRSLSFYLSKEDILNGFCMLNKELYQLCYDLHLNGKDFIQSIQFESEKDKKDNAMFWEKFGQLDGSLSSFMYDNGYDSDDCYYGGDDYNGNNLVKLVRKNKDSKIRTFALNIQFSENKHMMFHYLKRLYLYKLYIDRKNLFALKHISKIEEFGLERCEYDKKSNITVTDIRNTFSNWKTIYVLRLWFVYGVTHLGNCQLSNYDGNPLNAALTETLVAASSDQLAVFGIAIPNGDRLIHRWQQYECKNKDKDENENDDGNKNEDKNENQDNVCYTYKACYGWDNKQQDNDSLIFKYPDFSNCIKSYDKCNIQKLDLNINNSNDEILKNMFHKPFVQCPRLDSIELTITHSFDMEEPFEDFNQFKNTIISWRDWLLFDLNKNNKTTFGEFVINDDYYDDYLEKSIKNNGAFWEINNSKYKITETEKKRLNYLDLNKIRHLFNRDYSGNGTIENAFIRYDLLSHVTSKIQLKCILQSTSSAQFVDQFGLLFLAKGYLISFSEYINEIVISTLEQSDKKLIQSKFFEHYVATQIGKQVTKLQRRQPLW